MRLTILTLIASAFAAAGCGVTPNEDFAGDDRMVNGLVIILPGIEGESSLNHDIRQGLADAGISDALAIYNWGRPVPLAGMVLNQVDFIGNRIAAGGIARMIVDYQSQYPGRPVYLVGHSGGGGMAVFAAEGLPPGRQVDGVILLSASISAGYDLTKAMEHSRCGIVNYYNKDDIALLGIGTTIMGNVDGGRGPSAGLIGFDQPGSRDRPEKKQAYSRLYQVPISDSVTGDSDSHAAATRATFVSSDVAPWVTAKKWPVASALAAMSQLGASHGED